MVVSVKHSESDPGLGSVDRGTSDLVSVDCVGDVVRSLREEHGISARDLSKWADISPMQLWRIEQKKASPTKETIRRLARALNIQFKIGPAEVIVERELEAPLKCRETQQRLGDILQQFLQQFGNTQWQLEALNGELGGDVMLGGDTARKSSSSKSKSLITPIWEALPHGDVANTRFDITCHDAIGLLAEVTNIFKNAGVNIVDLAAIGGNDTSAERHIIISVPKVERAKLDQIAVSLCKIKKVIGLRVAVRSFGDVGDDPLGART